jgi:hypothetical protein
MGLAQLSNVDSINRIVSSIRNGLVFEHNGGMVMRVAGDRYKIGTYKVKGDEIKTVYTEMTTQQMIIYVSVILTSSSAYLVRESEQWHKSNGGA